MDFFPVKGLSKEKRISVQSAYNIFRRLCFERLMTIFIYRNAPFPQRELEYRLFKSGAAAIVHDDIKGTMVAWANLSGVTQYADVFTKVTYAAPTAKGGTKVIGEEAVVAYNNSLRLQMQSHVDLYASLLAHAYMSIKLALVNTRYQDIIATNTQQERENVKEWYGSLYDGKPIAILHDSLLSLNDSIINLSPSNKNVNVIELINAYNELWRCFYRDIGVRFTKEKKGNMVSDEVISDSQLLLYNIDDMLKMRQQLCADYNEVFVRRNKWERNEMTVEINPLFRAMAKVDDENANNDNG